MKLYKLLIEKINLLEKLNNSLGNPKLQPLQMYYDADATHVHGMVVCDLVINCLFWFDEIIESTMYNKLRDRIEEYYFAADNYNMFIALSDSQLEESGILDGYDITMSAYYQILVHIEDSERQLIRYMNNKELIEVR